ncbi:PREDICTED: transforming acidic coiled-coil-containing protein 2 isoform X3 [Aptenodytes forsteri]|uniref:transforming acidic coiled-coil-containing protein 2 isoform X3 n=1 Tax=Aptenodytes forsteri TaxID=9233 RepID=UPI0004F426BA|nr:PREDICTED: transforming acidic coiled-coil-containing protein 2 isoform X3 [Aptenodytes forsteri]
MGNENSSAEDQSAPQDSELGQPPGNGHGLKRTPQENSIERSGGQDISDLPAAVQLAESISPSIPGPTSISNEGISSYSAEDLSNPNSSMVSSEVRGQNSILQEHGGQTGSDFSKQAAEARERSLPTSMSFAYRAKTHVTADLTSNDKLPTSNCNEAVPFPGPVNDKEEGIAHAMSVHRGPKCDNIAATSIKNNENDPRNPSPEPSPPVAITEMQGVTQMSLNEFGLLWQSEQLGGMKEPHVSTFPQGKEAGDYFTAQEAKQERGVLEVGQPQTVMQQGRQNTDGGEGLLMKKETLILNYPATGGSDSEKFGAIVNAQVFTEISEVCNLQMGAVTTAKGDEANPALSGSKGEQSEACTLMSELPSNPPNLLVSKSEEPSREYVPGNDSQDPMRSEGVKTASEKNEPIFQRELQKEDELVSAEHFSVPLSFKREEEQKSAVTTESPKDEASSNEIIKADDVSRESTTLSETESIINPTKEHSLVDKRLLLEEYALSTSLSRSTDLNQKETEANVTGEKIRTEETRVTETSELPEGSSGADRQLSNSVSSHHQDVENTHLGHNPEEFSLCEKTSTGDLREEAGEKPLNLDSNFKSPEDSTHSLGCKPEQQMSKEKTAATDDLENKLVASLQFPREECPLSFDCFNTEAEDKTSGQPGCNGTEKVCLAHAHSSPLLHSENNNIKQSKQDESWVKAFARGTVLESECKTESQEKPESYSKSEESVKMSKSKLELQGLNELAVTMDCMAVQTEEALQVSETKEQISHITEVPRSDPEQGPAAAAAQSSAVDGKENEGIQQEKHQTAVKSFMEDKDLALKSECKSDVLMQAQQEQVAAESHRNMQMACLETSQAVASTSGLAPQLLPVHMEEGGDSHISENSCPSESDTCSFSEALECSIRELQENADVPTTLPQAEQMEKSVSVAGDSGWISNTGLEQQKQQSRLTTVTKADNREHKERALKPEWPLDLNNHSNMPEIPLNISNHLNKEYSALGPASIQCDSDTAKEKDKDKSSAVVSEDMRSSKHGQNISGVTMLNLQDCNEQNKTDLKAEENCRSKQNSNKPEQDNNSLISASQHEAACHSNTFSKESDKNEQPGSVCRIKDNTGESRAAAINALPGTQNSASATNISQASPSDTEIAHTSDNSEKNDPQISHPETQGKMPLMAKNSKKIEGLTADGEISWEDGNMEISCEDSASVTKTSNMKSDKSLGTQGSPSPLQAHGEVIPTDKSYKSSCIQKTPEEPGYCQANFTALSTRTSALSHPSQQPGNNTNSGTGEELLNNELEVVACQNALESNSNLQIAAGSQVSVRLGPSPRVSTGKTANSETSSVGNMHVNGKDVPDHSFQGDGNSSLALPETLNVGQSTGNLSQFNSEKLKKEISAIKSKETKSEANFKEQQSDSSAESLLALPTLEGKLLSLSSVGKQEGCNEEIASNICIDDKYGKILEKPGNSERMEELSKENNNVTRTEISISEQSAENSGREHEALTCSSLDIGSSLPDFREHISQIFKKTVHSTLSAELPLLLSENHAGFKQSPVAKDTAELCGAENFSESNKAGKGAAESTSEAEGQELSLATESSCKAAKGKTLQQENTVAELPPASLQDTEKNRLPGSCLEVVPRLEGATPAECALQNLQKPDKATEHPEGSEMKGKEGVCASGVDPELLISLEIKKQGPASFDGAAAENFPAYSDSKQQPAVAVISTGDVQKRDLEDAATAEGNNLITECNAEPVSSEEDVSLPIEQCQDPKPNEQEKSEYGDPDIAKSISDMAASTLVPGGSYNHEKLPDNFNVLPGENQETHIRSNFMHDIKSQNDMQMIQDDPVNRKYLETLENAQVAQQEKKVTMHGLIDYLKNEVSQDDCLQTDSKLESSNMTEGDVKESSDTVLSTAKAGNKKTGDIPETGTARMLVTGEGDLAINTSTEEQETYLYKNHSPAIPVMEQGEHSACTDLTVAENQPSKMNSEHESSLQDARRKLSPLALTEPKDLDLKELQDMAVAGLPTESPSGPVDVIQLASPLDPSEQPLAVSTVYGNVDPVDAAELTAARWQCIIRDQVVSPSVRSRNCIFVLLLEDDRLPLSSPADYILIRDNMVSSVHTSKSDSCKEVDNLDSGDVPLAAAPGDGVELPAQETEGFTREKKRSSDSEEAFETPESTTPVKAPPSPPQPPPEAAVAAAVVADIAEQEIKPQLPLEDTGLCSEIVPVTDVSHSESAEESPFRPPSHSFSTVFDEDKPIASSGTYNLDFDNIELVDSLHALGPSSPESKNRDPKTNVRRKSTDSVPVSKSTLSRSLSLQASDFDGASYLGNSETLAPAADVYGTGSSSASSTLKRTKKSRPASLKKKQSAKKSLDAPPVKETPQEPSDLGQAACAPGEDKPVSETKADSVKPECTELSKISAEEQEASPVPEGSYPLDPDSFEGISAFSTGGSKVQNSPPANKKTLPLTTAPEAVEVTPPDTGGQEDPPVKGIAVRLEFDYSEEKGVSEDQQESTPPPKKAGKKPGAKMPLRRPKTKKSVEKLDNAPTTPTKSPTDPNEIPITKGSYTFDIDKWDDPNFNPFSSSTKMQESPKLPQQTYSFEPDMCEDSVDPFKSSSKIASSPSKSPASFEIPASANEANGTEGDNLNKPAKKKKTPLKTDTFRVKKSPKRSPLSDPPSQDPTPLPTPETPPVISTVVHATDEEKLASSVTSQKWTCMTVDLNTDKQDYPQPSDLSTFVNETKFSSPTEELEYGNSYEIEYMEKIGSSVPQDDSTPKKQSLYLMFDAQHESPVKSPPIRLSDSTTPCSGSSFEDPEAQQSSGMKIQHPASRVLAASQEGHLQSSDKSKQKDLEPMTLGTTPEAIEITSPEDSFVSADALLNRISKKTSICDQPEYLDPDLAEKNPPVFAQKLQEELEFAAMRIEALKLARQITLSSFCSKREPAIPADVSISKSALYSRIGTSDAESTTGLLYPQQDLDSALRLARAEIVAKEREVSEWKEKYEESRREVMEMRKIVSEYEKTIAQMIEDEQREKSVSHHTVQQLIVEKEQALADLNSVEKSLADLFRRYEKMKEVLEGFRKNEEVLKKCAQEYLSRVKKEEQRYQALKIHAEEKLDRANAEIAQVRGKAQQEQAAYQASLRKEQLKVDALERTLEQKNKEIEELTKICDELIAKMGKS